MDANADVAAETRRHFVLSIGVAWPPLWFWLSQLFGGDAWTPGVVLPVPLILVTGVAAVWWVFTSVVWKAGETTTIAAGAAAVGGWFLLPWAAVRLGPWIGSGHVGVGAPNPLWFLAAIVGAFAVSWFSAGRISRSTRRGPTVALTVSLLAVAATSCLSVLAFQASEQAEEERLRGVAEWCHTENSGLDADGKEIRREGCVELAARVRASEPANLARAVDIYTWGCRQFESGSCAALARLHERGEGVSKDLAKARDLYSHGCASSYVTAAPSCIELGRMVHDGLGEKADVQRAYGVWGLSCERRPDLCTAMGRRYERGDGVTRNTESAGTLFGMACQHGDADGCADQARLQRK